MKKLVFLFVWLLSIPALAQRVDARVTTVTNPPPIGAYTPILAVPGSQIVLCAYPANGTPCTNLATSYTDATLMTACPAGKPVVLQGSSSCTSFTDQLGNFGFWVTPGCYTWTSQYNGQTTPPHAVCSGAGGTGTNSIATYAAAGLTPGGKAYVYPGQVTGSIADVCEAINAAGLTLPSNGGVIDATGLGSAEYTCTNKITALNHNSQAVVLVLSPATRLIMNVALATTTSPANCAIAVGPTNQPFGASGILIPGTNYLGGYNIQVGDDATMFGLICSGTFTGGQESMFLDGVGMSGDTGATVTGAILYLAGIFGPTRIDNSGTSLCFAQCVDIVSGNGGSSVGAGNMMFYNDVFQDSYTGSQVYPGSVVNFDTLSSSGGLGNIKFEGGIIQQNGPFNPLITMNGHGSTQLSTIVFSNTYFEIRSAGTSAYWTNTDPIQITDANQIWFDNIKFGGDSAGAGQSHYIDISTTDGVQSTYSINIEQLTGNISNGYSSLIHNTVEGTDETGFPASGGDRALPPYHFGGAVPFVRMTNYTPPSSTCTTATLGSMWTYSAASSGAFYVCQLVSSTPTWTQPSGGGGGAVSSVANSDGTITISPTTGSVVASLALGHANVWTGVQTIPLASASTAITQSLTDSTTKIATTAYVQGNFASPPAIGSTTPAAGTFTTLKGTTPSVSDNSTNAATTAYEQLLFASPPALGSTTPNVVNATVVKVVNGTLTGFAGSGAATYTPGATAQVGTSAPAPICLSSFTCNSIAGTVSLTTGTGSLSAGTIVTILLPGTRTNPGGSIYPPNCSVTIVPTTGTAANYGVGVIPTNTTGAVTLPVTVLTALAASTTYIIHYGPCEGI